MLGSPKRYPLSPVVLGLELEGAAVDAVALAGRVAGPSSKTWPRCASQREQSTSVRRIRKLLSASVSTDSSSIGRSKLGQPVPESNLLSELNSGLPAGHADELLPAP